MRDTSYAREIASAEVNYCRIERLFVKGNNQEEIRFSWWPDGKLANRPLDLPEEHLLKLFKEAISNGVFSDTFLKSLHSTLYDQRPKNGNCDAHRT